MLYAEHEQKVLVVLQAMDTGGKDGVINRVFQGVNPQGVRVAHFKEPTPERKFWKEYMKAYEDALNKTSTEWAPWYLIPANHKWYRDLTVSRVIVKVMEKMDLHYPKTKAKLGSVVIE